jgi:hypothetical protein
MGVIKYHLLYEYRKNDDGKPVPVTSGYFKHKVCLPYSGGLVDNPWECDPATRYFKRNWLKESTLWSCALVVLLKRARKAHIYDNDQHMEGVFNSIKHQPDRKIDCDEPAFYFHSRFKYLEESN